MILRLTLVLCYNSTNINHCNLKMFNLKLFFSVHNGIQKSIQTNFNLFTMKLFTPFYGTYAVFNCKLMTIIYYNNCYFKNKRSFVKISSNYLASCNKYKNIDIYFLKYYRNKIMQYPQIQQLIHAIIIFARNRFSQQQFVYEFEFIISIIMIY